MYHTAGFCNKCGAPMYVPSIWYGIYPPTPQPSCRCPLARQVQTFGPYVPSRSIPTGWEDYVNPPNQMTPQGWEKYVQHLQGQTDSETCPDVCPEECTPKETTPLERAQNKHRSVAEKIAETRKELEKIKARQKAAENNDLSGVESLGKAIGESEEEERVSALEGRMDRLENMMVNLAQNLTEVKRILTEKAKEERRISDDGK